MNDDPVETLGIRPNITTYLGTTLPEYNILYPVHNTILPIFGGRYAKRISRFETCQLQHTRDALICIDARRAQRRVRVNQGQGSVETE